jgi:hypothetical protein
MTTPRELLIETVREKMIAVPRSTPYFDGRSERKVTDLAQAALQALSDLGAVVLMPVSPADLDYGERGQADCFVDVLMLRIHDEYVLDGGSTHYMASDTVYVNALEGEGES